MSQLGLAWRASWTCDTRALKMVSSNLLSLAFWMQNVLYNLTSLRSFPKNPTWGDKLLYSEESSYSTI